MGVLEDLLKSVRSLAHTAQLQADMYVRLEKRVEQLEAATRDEASRKSLETPSGSSGGAS